MTQEDDKITETPLDFDINAKNIALELSKSKEGKEFLRKLSERCMRNFETAWESTEHYRTRAANDWRLFTGDLPPKPPPFENVPNPHVPIMLSNLSRITMRAQAELFGDWTNVFSVPPVGPDDREVSELLSLHGNWQIRAKLTDFKRQMYRGLLQFYVNGDVTAHSYYDEDKRRNCHEILTPDEFVIPFVLTTTEPDYSDVPFKCKILRRYRHQLQKYRDSWLEVDEVLKREPPDWDSEPEAKQRMEMANVQGQEAPTDTSTAPYVLIWYEGYHPLPGSDEDRYILAIFDKETKRCMCMRLHEEENWQDRIRYDRQVKELEDYSQAVASYPEQVAMLEGQKTQIQGMLADPLADPQEVALMQQALAQAQPPPEPQPPEWLTVEEDGSNTGPEPVRMEPIQSFSHGVCIEPIVGSLGISFGRIEADINRAANIAISQFADSADFNNINAYFIANGVEFEGGPPKIFPGAMIKVRGLAADLEKSILPLKPGPASAQLPDLVQMCVGWGQEVLQSPAVLSGESGKSGETYRGIAARIEQATKQLSVSARKFADFFEQIMKNNGQLNALYLDDEEIFYVNDHRLGTSKELRAGRKLYQRDYRVEIRADLRFTTQAARVSEADEALQLPQIVPPLAGNLGYWYAATKAALEARELHHLVPQLGPAPPPPGTPFGLPMPGMAPPPGAPPQPGAGAPTPGAEPQRVGPMAAQGGPSGPPTQPQAPGPVQNVTDHGGGA